MKILTTKNYDAFKTIDGNRNTIKHHITELAQAIKKQNLTMYSPILVNEKMEVVDGQNRLEALKVLKAPVNYVVIKGADLGTVQMLNSTSKSWTLNDYVKSYSKLGNENYIILDEFKTRYQFPLTMSASLLGGFSVEEKNIGNWIKNGSFVASNIAGAEAVATYLMEIRKNVDKSLFSHREFLSACVKIIGSDINRKQLIHKMQIFGHLMKRQPTRIDYLREFERIYNFRNQGEKVRLF